MDPPARHDGFAALRHPEFRRLALATFLVTSAVVAQQVLLGYELYLLTRDPLALGMIGLAEAVPFISLVLFGGVLADRLDKVRLVQASLAIILCTSVALAVLLLPAVRTGLAPGDLVAAIYAAAFALGLARGIHQPAGSSLRAFLVPREVFPNSAAWSSTAWQSGMVLGPAAAGLGYAVAGLDATLWGVAATLLLALGSVSGIAPRRGTPTTERLWASLVEGLAYVRRTRPLWYAMWLDMVAVFFGSVVMILPMYAEDVLHVDARGLGLLRAAPAVGAVLVMLWCAWRPPTGRTWRNLLVAVAGFGMATLVFAVSESFWLSALMLLLTGAFDSVSVVIRQTLLQALPPDHLRGRAVAANSIFISASNELGAFESGVAAKWLGLVPSVLLGGALTLVTVGETWRRSRDLLRQRLP